MQLVACIVAALLLAIPSPEAIRSVDFREVITRRLGLMEACAGTEPILSLDVKYADLTDDRREEAIVNAGSCRAAGALDFAAVYSMSWSGQPVELVISTGDRDPSGLFGGRTGTPRLDSVDGTLVQSWETTVTNQARPRHKPGWKRVVTYRWTGEAFVIDTIVDGPPEEGPED